MTVASTTTSTAPGTPPAAPADTARLEFPRGAQRLTVRVDAGMSTLYRARFGGPRPRVHEAGRTVTIDYPRLAPSGWPSLSRRTAEIELNPFVAWDLALAGVSRMQADLRGLELHSLEVSGGASDLDLVLPAPRGVVPVRIGGGSRAVTLRRAGDAAARLHVGGGASRLAFDEQHLGAVGGGIRLQSRDADRAADRYEIEVEGGASRLIVARVD